MTERLRLAGLADHGPRGFEGRQRQRQGPRKGPGSIGTEVDANPRPASFWVISPCNECPDAVGGFAVELTDDIDEVVGDGADALAGEQLWSRTPLLHGDRVVGPVGGDGGVTGGFKHLPPARPAAGKQPQAMTEQQTSAKELAV